MPSEAILAGVFFVGLFMAWVVAPTYIRRRHALKIEDEDMG